MIKINHEQLPDGNVLKESFTIQLDDFEFIIDWCDLNVRTAYVLTVKFKGKSVGAQPTTLHDIGMLRSAMQTVTEHFQRPRPTVSGIYDILNVVNGIADSSTRERLREMVKALIQEFKPAVFTCYGGCEMNPRGPVRSTGRTPPID